MIHIKIEQGKTKQELSHPESFNELSSEQFRAVAQYFLLQKQPLANRFDDQLILLQEFLSKNLSKNVKTKWFNLMNAMVKEGLIDELLKLQDFLTKEQTFNNWILQELKLEGSVFHGPRNRFSYMSFGQFIFADMMFMQYFDSKSDVVLNRFIAALYLNHPKEEFSTDNLEEKASKMASLSVVDKQAILFNYSSVRTWLSQKYPFVFNSEEKQDSQEIVLGKSDQNGWMSVRRHLAGDVLNLEKVDRVLLHDVMADLNEKISNQ